jgi:phosphoribosyl-AMP cyclohydrolase
MADSVEETAAFTPRFNASGLIPVIIADGKGVLMFAHMNDEALARTRETGLVHFWSRSRGRLWQKGETSGERLRVQAILTDCDQDVLLIEVTVEGRGAVCHTGRRSCFYRKLDGNGLVFTDNRRLFDPDEVYGVNSPPPSWGRMASEASQVGDVKRTPPTPPLRGSNSPMKGEGKS